MSQRLVNTHVFVPGVGGVGTITFSDFTAIELKRVQLITNIADGIIIFNFADPAKTGTVATNVLTLTFDTSGMAAGDALQILYNYEEAKTESAHAQRTTAGTTTLKTVAAGEKVVVTALSAFSDNTNTTDAKITFKVGANIIRQHPNLAPGVGFIEIGAGERGEIIEGADGEDFTCDTDGTETIDVSGSFQLVKA